VVYWTIKGKEYTEAEYAEFKKKQEEVQGQAQIEVWRLVNELGEAYKACSEFMEQHPEVPYKVMDAQAREHALYQKLRQNLERADTAPRCEKVREDGTVCGCPQMKGYRYCYAHERMLEMRSGRLELPALEDANGIQMAIMRVQKALIDDEISEKKAGLLLYSLQMASSNLKHTTFTGKDKQVVTEMVESPRAPTSRVIGKTLPLINADNTDRKPAASSEQSVLSQGKCKNLPRINADERGSKPAVSRKRLPKLPALPRSPELGKQSPNTYHGDTEARRSEGRPQPGAAVPHEHLVG
jgi:hypothetical protein